MKTKVYDKEMYKRNEDIRNAIIIMFVFMIGFVLGCVSMHFEYKNTTNELEENIQNINIQ